MLFQKLLGVNTGAAGLVFVGGRAIDNSSTSTPNCSLTGLSGGIASAPAIGDLVIAAIGFVNSTNRDITTVSSGWTEVADLYANSIADTQLGVFYKYLTAADKSVQFSLGTTVISKFVTHVWRSANSSSPLDATTTTATLTNSSSANPPAIGVVTDGAVVIAVGVAADHSSGTSLDLTVPSGMENFFKTTKPSTTDTPQLAIASVLINSGGSYDPGLFGGGRANSGNSWCAATLAIRPA